MVNPSSVHQIKISIMKTRYSKGHAESMTEADSQGNAWQITTNKNSRGIVQCTAVQGTLRDGMFSYEMFGGKRMNLAQEEGTATEKRILAVHARGLAEFEKATASQEKPYEIQVGQVFFTEGPFNTERRAVYEVIGQGRYKTVTLDGEHLRTDDHVRPLEDKFGIGVYYKKGDTIPAEEVDTLVATATYNEMVRREAKQKQEEEAKADRLSKIAIGAQKLTAIPEGVVAVIKAHLREDDSDPQSDYFSHKTVKTIYLAFSRHQRDLFTELRAAARLFEETAGLANEGPEVEHREKYSMGEGYYLGHSRNSGWVVKKSRIYRDRDTLESMQMAIADGRYFCDKQIPSEEVSVPGTPGEGFIATCRINEAKGGIEIYFKAKPSTDILTDLKSNGFRWAKFNKCWYKHDSAYARKVVGKYAQLPEEPNPDGLLVEAEANAKVDAFTLDNL